jgi:hypothetical protein
MPDYPLSQHISNSGGWQWLVREMRGTKGRARQREFQEILQVQELCHVVDFTSHEIMKKVTFSQILLRAKLANAKCERNTRNLSFCAVLLYRLYSRQNTIYAEARRVERAADLRTGGFFR